MKKVALSLALFFSFLPLVEALEYENPFITPQLNRELKSFLTFEIKKDFKEAIASYNKQRAKPEISAHLLKWHKLNMFGITELPPIEPIKDHYLLEDGEHRITFSIDLILKGKFLVDGKERSFSDRPMAFSSSASQEEAPSIFPSALGKKNLAALLFFSERYEEIGFLCMFDCNGEKVKKNQARLFKRLNRYRADCENNASRRSKKIAVFYYTKDFDIISEARAFSYKMTYEFLNDIYKYEKENTLARRSLASENSCQVMASGMFRIYAPEVFTDPSVQLAFDNEIKNLCDSINSIQVCMAKFYNQATAIYDNSKKEHIKEYKRFPADTLFAPLPPTP